MNVWRYSQRFSHIKQRDFRLLLLLAERLRDHRHDLMHKAIRMDAQRVRHIDSKVLLGFLDANAAENAAYNVEICNRELSAPPARALPWITKRNRLTRKPIRLPLRADCKRTKLSRSTAKPGKPYALRLPRNCSVSLAIVIAYSICALAIGFRRPVSRPVARSFQVFGSCQLLFCYFHRFQRSSFSVGY